MVQQPPDGQVVFLRAAFFAGAVTDAFCLLPMLVPRVCHLLWGWADLPGPYRFAMGYAASLMLAWTVLLVWAFLDPLPRRFIAALTVLILYGLIATEIVAVHNGYLKAGRMIPTWVLQACLLALFAGGYHYPLFRKHFGGLTRR